MKCIYHNRNFSIKSEDLDLETEKVIKVQKHIIKKGDFHSYNTGIINLSTKLFPYSKYRIKKHLLIKLEYPCRIRFQGWWGLGSIIFIPEKGSIERNQHLIKQSSRQYDLGKFKKFIQHKRKSKSKYYSSLKAFVPFRIGSKVYIWKFKNKFRIEHNIQNLRSQINNQKVTQIGAAYLIFEKRDFREMQELALALKKNKTKKYETVIDLLKQGRSLAKIASSIKVSTENAVWKHIAVAYKNGIIDLMTLRDIIERNSSMVVRENLLILAEKIKLGAQDIISSYGKGLSHKEFLDFSKEVYKNEFSITNLRRVYLNETGVYLMDNHIECILLFYKARVLLELTPTKSKSASKINRNLF